MHPRMWTALPKRARRAGDRAHTFPFWSVCALSIILLPGVSLSQTSQVPVDESIVEADLSADAIVLKSCLLGKAGDGCIFDLRATATGTLIVCSKSRRNLERWRSSLGLRLTNGAVSSVGTGSTIAFTGCVSRAVTLGSYYELIVNYEYPLPGAFPTGVDLQFSGPVAVPDARVRSDSPESAASCSEVVGCGSLVNCSISPIGDTDVARFNAPAGSAVSIAVSRRSGVGTPCWRVIGPAGPLTGWACGTITETQLSTTAAQLYTVEIAEANFDQTVDYALSLQGISQSFSCGAPIGFGQLKSGRIESVGDTDAFNFTGTQSNVVSITVVRTAGVGTPCVKVFGPTGAAISGWLCNGQGTLTLPATGKYTAVVADAYVDQTVDYNVSLQLLGHP